VFMKSASATRSLIHQPHRDAWLEVHLGHLEHNCLALKKGLPNHHAVMAVVKADAYGHGVEALLPTLQACGVSQLGVSTIDEAVQLRQAGVTLPVLVLGPSPFWALSLASQYNVQLTVFHSTHLLWLQQAKQPLSVQVKVDTGMHRVGVAWHEAVPFIGAIEAVSPHVKLTGVFTHLACADNEAINQRQRERFNTVLQAIDTTGLWIHSNNTHGALHESSDEQSFCNLSRLGVGLYGQALDAEAVAVKPLLGLKARLTQVQRVPSGEGISYNHAYKTPLDAPPQWIGTLPVGYADGVSRGLSNQLQVQYRGQLVPQVGMITMDQLMINLTSVVEATGVLPTLGETVTLLSHEPDAPEALTVAHWASLLATIAYEVVCQLRVRLPRIYVR
jgi:alanine racemase